MIFMFQTLLDHPQCHFYNASHLVMSDTKDYLTNHEITTINPLKILL
jgi:hypothetical protein